MNKEQDKRRRQSIRLKGYDYTKAGAYFITLCVQNRERLFGQVVQGKMRLNDAGRIVQSVWDGLPGHYPHVVLDAFVVMPDHVHGIIVLDGVTVGTGMGNGDAMVGAGLKPAPTGTMGMKIGDGDMGMVIAGTEIGDGGPATGRHGLTEIVRAFKTFSARNINEHRLAQGTKVWQRNYYESIIREDESLGRIRQYITDNPLRGKTF